MLTRVYTIPSGHEAMIAFCRSDGAKGSGSRGLNQRTPSSTPLPFTLFPARPHSTIDTTGPGLVTSSQTQDSGVAQVHTYLFQEGIWVAKGEYVDEAMNRASLEGETKVIHGPDVWLNEGRMTLSTGGKTVEIENLYRIVPFAAGSDFTKWESFNPALGALRGHFIVIGNAILSSCTSADSRYTGAEFLLQEDADRYINRGTLFSASAKISSWTLTLIRKVQS
jgi:hypothetical protein